MKEKLVFLRLMSLRQNFDQFVLDWFFGSGLSQNNFAFTLVSSNPNRLMVTDAYKEYFKKWKNRVAGHIWE